MSWDNGNGQQNYGYDPVEAALQRLDGATRTPTTREPYMGVGNQELDIISIEPFNHTTHGPSARAIFDVVSSDSHRPGERVAQTWNLVKPPPKPGMITDGERFADFVRKVRGMPDGTPMGRDIRALLKERTGEQLARGVRIKAFGVNKGKDGKTFVVPSWTHVPQDPNEIAQRRAAIEAKLGAQQQAPAQPQYSPQAQQFVQQYQQQPQVLAAPPPHLAPQPVQYAPQPQAQQYAPQPPAPTGTGTLLSQIPGTPPKPGQW